MLYIPLVESSYWECNILGENLCLINSDKNQIWMWMWIRQPDVDPAAFSFLLKSSFLDIWQGSECTSAFWY